jgi:hypothetical protein
MIDKNKKKFTKVKIQNGGKIQDGDEKLLFFT